MATFFKPKSYFFLYAGLMIFFGVVAGSYFPDNKILIFQCSMVVSICLCYYPLLSKRLRFSVFLPLLCLFQFLWIICFRYFNVAHFNNPLGYNPIDSLFYHDIGRRFVLQGYSIWSLPSFLSKNTQGVDDWGFSGIVSLFYKVFGINTGINALAISNVICITLSAYLLYLLAKNFTTEFYARSICFLWAILPFGLYTASVGLKENFMVFMVIAAVYYVYSFMKRPSLKAFVLFAFFASMLLLFRTAIFFMLLLTFMFAALSLLPGFAHKINLWMILLAVLAFIFFAAAVDYIADIRGNVNSESLGQKTETIAEQQSLLVVILTNLSANFIGPFPSFISDPYKVNYITLYNFGAFIKIMLSFYYLYGIFFIIKHKIVYFYPMLIFIALHSLMLIITFYSLHDRFQWPQIPFVLFLSLFGFQAYWQHQGKKWPILPTAYSFVMILLIIFYNLRLS